MLQTFQRPVVFYTMYIDHDDDKHPTQPGVEADTSRLLLQSQLIQAGHRAVAVSSSPRPWIDVFALPDYSPIFSDMTVQRNVSRFYARSICG